MNMIFEVLWEKRRGGKSSGGPSASPKLKGPGGKGGSGKSGHRGRRSGQKRYLSNQGARVKAVVRSQFVYRSADSHRRLRSYVHYVQERERGEGEREESRKIFDRERNDIDRVEAGRELLDNEGKRVSFHAMILSPGDNTVDLKEYARDAMDKLEDRMGCDLKWVAVAHENTDHHHVHVIVAGGFPEQDRHPFGAEREGDDVRLYREDLDFLRETGNDYILRQREIDRAYDREVQKELGLDREYGEKDLGLTDRDQDRKIARELEIGQTKTDREYAKEFQTERDWGLDRILEEIHRNAYTRRSDKEERNDSCELAYELARSDRDDRGDDQDRSQQHYVSDLAYDMVRGDTDSPDRDGTDHYRDQRPRERDDDERGQR